jgi:hypothetical protein
MEPMQAKLVTKLPEGDRWLYETKLDGYRAIAIKDRDRVELRSRNNKDLTAAYPTVCAALKKLRTQNVVLDGEIVAVDSSGIPSFQALQHRSARTDHQIVYYAFDALHGDGKPLAHLPLEERRSELPKTVKGSGVLLSVFGDLVSGERDSTLELNELKPHVISNTVTPHGNVIHRPHVSRPWSLNRSGWTGSPLSPRLHGPRPNGICDRDGNGSKPIIGIEPAAILL